MPDDTAADVEHAASVGLDTSDLELAVAVGRALFQWALDPIMLTQPVTGEILDANPAACRVLGLSVEQIRERGRDGLRDPDDDRWAAGVRERTRTGWFVGELSMRRGDGSTFPAEVSSAVFDVHGRPYAALVFRDVTETRNLERRLRDAVEELSRQATSDDLTGLLNRRGFMTVGRQLVEDARRGQHPLVVLLADVDGLKAVNDRYGHPAGDDMLRDVGATLTAHLRGADVIARIGGDEFAVLLAGAHAPADAAHAAERVNAHLADRAREQQRPYPLSVSIGVAVGRPGAAYDLETLLRDADRAMYDVKRAHVPEPSRGTPQQPVQ